MAKELEIVGSYDNSRDFVVLYPRKPVEFEIEFVTTQAGQRLTDILVREFCASSCIVAKNGECSGVGGVSTHGVVLAKDGNPVHPKTFPSGQPCLISEGDMVKISDASIAIRPKHA